MNERTPPPSHPSPSTTEIVFLLVEGFTHLSLSSSIEVLRVANLLAEEDLFHWSLMAPGGQQQTSSNGLVTLVHHDLKDLRHDTELYVVSGIHAQSHSTKALRGFLRAQHRHGVQLGAFCSGAIILADAGLLSGQVCAVHWEYYAQFREHFPDVTVTENIFYSAARPITASGGTASAELMLDLVARAHGKPFAQEIAEQLGMTIVRTEDDVQRMPAHIRFGTRNPILLRVLEYMNANIEEPLTNAEIAKYVGVSIRQIERVFQRHLGHSPGRHYKRLRLNHARTLLATTDMTVIQVATACGFASTSNFSKVYRSTYNETPYAIHQRNSYRL